jgi:hypothetical protein
MRTACLQRVITTGLKNSGILGVESRLVRVSLSAIYHQRLRAHRAQGFVKAASLFASYHQQFALSVECPKIDFEGASRCLLPPFERYSSHNEVTAPIVES